MPELGAPAGGVPWGREPEGLELEPEPMFGQLWVDDEPEPPVELEPEDGVVAELDEPVVPDVPDELVDVVEDPELVVDVVVAASATSPPPMTRPEASAPMPTTVRNRGFTVGCLSL